MGGLFTELVVILALIVANGVLAGAEIAIVSVRRSRIRQLMDEGNSRAIAVEKLHANAESFLATVTIGITVVSSLASVIGGARIADPIAQAIAKVPIESVAHASRQLALGAVVVGISFFSITVGELVPKSLALRNAEPLALFIAKPLIWMGKVARPFVWFLTAVSNLVLKPFHDRTKFTETRLSAEEIKLLIGEAIASGAIEKRLAEIIERAVDFGELTVDDVKVPRPAIKTVDRAADIGEIRRVLLEEGHTRMPVVDGSIDKVIGYVTARDIVNLVFEKELIHFEDVVRPAFFVPETMRAVDLLRALQKRREHLAIVVDEYGGTSGLCTMEDLVEEIVGEIFSEDSADVPDLIRREADGSALVSGTLAVREFNRAFEAEVPEEEGFDTVAGLVTHLAGAIPAAGQSFERYGFRFTVTERTERRVKTVRVKKTAPPPEKGE